MYRFSALAIASLLGALNRATAPVPSVLPAYPAAPAMVVNVMVGNGSGEGVGRGTGVGSGVGVVPGPTQATSYNVRMEIWANVLSTFILLLSHDQYLPPLCSSDTTPAPLWPRNFGAEPSRTCPPRWFWVRQELSSGRKMNPTATRQTFPLALPGSPSRQ